MLRHVSYTERAGCSSPSTPTRRDEKTVDNKILKLPHKKASFPKLITVLAGRTSLIGQCCL